MVGLGKRGIGFFFTRFFGFLKITNVSDFLQKFKLYQVQCIRLTKKCIRFFYQVKKLYQGEKYQVFEIFDFPAGWTLKFSAFPYIRLHDWVFMYTTLFMYHVLCTRFWFVPGFLLPGFLSFLKCTRFQSTRYFKKVSGLRYQVGESTS